LVSIGKYTVTLEAGDSKQETVVQVIIEPQADKNQAHIRK
jgi:hypothetical protein